MRHQRDAKKLGRNIKQRQALFKSLLTSLILNDQIKTTEAKAKAIKPLIDKLMTKAKNGSLSYRRQVIAFLSHKKAANYLFDVISPRTQKRTSGFTRIVRLGQRKGDNTMMAKIEFIDSGKRVDLEQKKDSLKLKKKSSEKSTNPQTK